MKINLNKFKTITSAENWDTKMGTENERKEDVPSSLGGNQTWVLQNGSQMS